MSGGRMHTRIIRAESLRPARVARDLRPTTPMATPRHQLHARRVMSILPPLPTDGEGHFTGVTCPDCSGMLVIRMHRSLVSFVCRIGHVYSPLELLAAKEELLERRLWIGFSSMDELAKLLEDFTRLGIDAGNNASLRERGAAAREQADRLRSIIEADRPVVPRCVAEQSMRDTT